MATHEFYDQLTPFYHLIYPDWESTIKSQSSQIDSIIKEYWGDRVSSILDVSCGIGTQSLGLAQLGYNVTASDLSQQEIERAKIEAKKRRLELNFHVGDMREAFNHQGCQFDLVISCDNAIPHLLTDEDILAAFKQFYQCTDSGGGCLISVRDYEKETLVGTQVKPYGTRQENGHRYLIFQVWDCHGTTYDVSMYFVDDCGGAECTTHVMRSQYYAVPIPKLISLMEQAGFVDVQRLDNRFFQPVIIGKKVVL
jgi:SAM-dependent methyltransferase